MDFKTKLGKWNELINDELKRYNVTLEGPGSDICKAMEYSLMAGGKRLRPVLALAVCELLDGEYNDVLPYACAIEMIHTYSLIHDDLPAMDNDDYRRGLPTSHKVFGEAIAILAGDALLNRAFEVMLESTVENAGNREARLKAMQLIAESAGAKGMVRGQVIDLESEGAAVGKETLECMHKCKTGALIKAPVLAAALICGASEADCGRLSRYAENIGLAFQIKDDIMDVKGSPEKMGKAVGKDAARNKTTYATLYGTDEAERLLCRAVENATDALGDFGEKADFLRKLAIFIKDRNN